MPEDETENPNEEAATAAEEEAPSESPKAITPNTEPTKPLGETGPSEQNGDSMIKTMQGIIDDHGKRIAVLETKLLGK